MSKCTSRAATACNMALVLGLAILAMAKILSEYKEGYALNMQQYYGIAAAELIICPALILKRTRLVAAAIVMVASAAATVWLLLGSPEDPRPCGCAGELVYLSVASRKRILCVVGALASVVWMGEGSGNNPDRVGVPPKRL
jgi:hypothetical protein